MNQREMNKLIQHFEYYFNQCIYKVFHDNDREFHTDVLMFEPNEKYPFYKLVTMGASDYEMPKVNSSLPNRNEYILFLSPEMNIDSEDFKWYLNFLIYIAKYAFYENAYISVGHSIELDPDNNSIFNSGFVLFPQIIEDSWVLTCKLGMLKKCACLQVMPITKSEVDKKNIIGSKAFHDCFYPEEGSPIYLADRKINL